MNLRVVATLLPTVLMTGGLTFLAYHATEQVAQGAPQRSARIDASQLTPFRSSASDRAHRCAVHDPSLEQSLAIEQAIQAAGKNAPSGGMVQIPVYWHIVTLPNGAGDVSGRVDEQMAVLNTAYAASGFIFRLENVRVVANSTWFFSAIGSPEEQQMKAALRQGGPEALNIYTTNGDVYLGWATPAFYYKFFPAYDGVVLWWAALPGTGLGGTAAEEPDGFLKYDGGDTGTHEVGHWLGLDHTFAFGCQSPGDKINDTPAEAEPQFYCAPRDSCTAPQHAGVDPITNFMDYTDDDCMDHFTLDQTTRMRQHWHAFRTKKAR
jgi:hypothetical protein